MNKEICVLGSGMVSIFRSDFGRDPLSYFKDDDRIFIARDIEDARKREQNGEKVALIINGPLDVLWCCPVINGELKQGMFSGAFVYTSNDVVMTGYSHPIRLMDRFENPATLATLKEVKALQKGVAIMKAEQTNGTYTLLKTADGYKELLNGVEIAEINTETDEEAEKAFLYMHPHASKTTED